MEGIQSFLSSPYFPNPTPRIALVRDEILTASYMYECCTGNHFLRPPTNLWVFATAPTVVVTAGAAAKKQMKVDMEVDLVVGKVANMTFFGDFFCISWWIFLDFLVKFFEVKQTRSGTGTGVGGPGVLGPGSVGPGSGGFGVRWIRVRWVQGPMGSGSSGSGLFGGSGGPGWRPRSRGPTGT